MNKSGFILIFLIVTYCGLWAQEKTRKELKEEQKLEQQKLIEEMIVSGTFTFIGVNAFPQGRGSVSLTSRPNYVKYSPDLIECDMPYFGRAYSGASFGSDGGLNFTGKPEEYAVTKNKKEYLIKAKVKGTGDSYNLSLTVSFSGDANLVVVSNNRSTISYSGGLAVPVKKEEKK
jgi:hypothetical protein